LLLWLVSVLSIRSYRIYNQANANSLLSVAVSAMALTPNVAGSKDVGNGKAQQFTTGGCVADADCRSDCCAEISGSGLGICSAVGAQRQNGKLGCGFTDPNAAVRTLHSICPTTFLTRFQAVIAAAKAQVAKQGFKFKA
jgi:hypothetical protein